MNKTLSDFDKFEACERIDYCYLALKQLRIKTYSPRYRSKQEENEMIDTAIQMLNQIIADKKLLGLPYNTDLLALEELAPLS